MLQCPYFSITLARKANDLSWVKLWGYHLEVTQRLGIFC